jgi:hypothetical protein
VFKVQMSDNRSNEHTGMALPWWRRRFSVRIGTLRCFRQFRVLAAIVRFRTGGPAADLDPPRPVYPDILTVAEVRS